MKKFKYLIIGLIVLSFIVTGVSFLFLDGTIPTHIGINGKPDQYGSKYFLIIFPIVATLVGGTMLLVARYGKVSENYKKYMLLTGVIIEALFAATVLIFSIYAISYTEDTPAFDISKVILLIMGVLFIVLGNFLPKIEKNRTLGIKTKWSMYNEVTWQKTHRFAGFASIIMGFLLLITSLLFKEMVNFIIFISLLATFMIVTTIASYKYYQQEK